jgi:hypothetical protein
VEFDLGGGTIVAFDLSDDALRNHRNPAIRSAATSVSPDDDPRQGLSMAAMTVTEHLLDPKRDPDRPITVEDDGVVTFVPLRSIRSVRLIFPESAKGKPVGFATDYPGS